MVTEAVREAVHGGCVSTFAQQILSREERRIAQKVEERTVLDELSHSCDSVA